MSATACLDSWSPSVYAMHSTKGPKVMTWAVEKIVFVVYVRARKHLHTKETEKRREYINIRAFKKRIFKSHLFYCIFFLFRLFTVRNFFSAWFKVCVIITISVSSEPVYRIATKCLRADQKIEIHQMPTLIPQGLCTCTNTHTHLNEVLK